MRDDERRIALAVAVLSCAVLIECVYAFAVLFGGVVPQAQQRERSPQNAVEWQPAGGYMPDALLIRSPQNAVEWQPAGGYMPDVLLIKATAPDGARVCVEWFGEGQGQPLQRQLQRPRMDCRTFGELRKWVRERSAK